MTADIAQEEDPTVSGQREHVVEVATHIPRRGGMVVAGQLQTGHSGQRRREQGALQGGREGLDGRLVLFDRGLVPLDLGSVVLGLGPQRPFGPDGVQRGEPQLQLIHDDRSQISERGQACLGDLTGFGVEHVHGAQVGAQVVPIPGGDGCGGVETHPHLTVNQRIPCGTRVGQRIIDHIRAVLVDGSDQQVSDLQRP